MEWDADDLPPEATLGDRLALATVSELRASTDQRGRTESALRSLQAQVDDLGSAIQRLEARPTLGSVLAQWAETRSGAAISSHLIQAALWLSLAVAAWATGAIQMPDAPASAIPPIKVRP